MTRALNRFLLLSSCLLAIACGDDDGTPAMDASVANDSAAAMDSATSGDSGTGIMTDTGPAADGGPATDGGPAPDAGPAMDAGSPPADSGPPPACGDINGVYNVTAHPTNPALCGAVMIPSCTVADGSSANTRALTCGSIDAECTLDADCVCTGMVTVSGISGTVAVDFPGGTATVNALSMMCGFDLAM